MSVTAIKNYTVLVVVSCAFEQTNFSMPRTQAGCISTTDDGRTD